MKRKIIAFVFIAAILAAGVSFLIPSRVKIDETVFVKAKKNTVNRAINDIHLWKKWWPGSESNTSPINALRYNNTIYEPQLPGLYAVAIGVKYGSNSYKTILSIVEYNADSVLLSWKGSISVSSNPFTRISRYMHAKRVGDDMKNILYAAQKFMSDLQNVYGIAITNQIVKDTLLLNTQAVFTHPPSTDEIYTLINKLAKAAEDEKAPVTGYPMMNITKEDGSTYLLRVALPVSQPVKEEHGIVIKRMVRGNILVSNDITGGRIAVEHACKQMMNYVHDFNKTLAAISFQSLITNRQLEKDSTKWITRIYCPVI
ncbi:hypothetical protein [Agriterribacter sp.]|uniref:hypothetical protein n=1 Tax=Agriterribacter sp. TaxID=2821509 RepID=UPI002C5C1D47|nr:hypothetical protein [Agriterribacter sp.]HRP56763.1 hypothetical protein [Agriterribacter sp.]